MQKEKRTLGNKTIALVAAVFVAGIALGFIAGRFLGGKTETADKKDAQDTVVEQSAEGEDYDVTECVTLGTYTGRTVSLKVTEDDLQAEIDNILEENTVYVKIKNRKAQANDKVYAKYTGSIDGEKIDSASGEDYIDLGIGEWLPEFDTAIIGMKPGQKKTFSVDVPEGTYGDDTVDGKTVSFTVKLKYICGDAITPEYNDELVQSISEYETVEQYNAYLQEKLEQENEDEKEEFVWTDVLGDCEIEEYPDSLMEAAREEVLNGYYDMADLYNVSHDEIFQQFGCEDEQDFKDTQLDDLAKDTVKEHLVAQAIAVREDISYTQEEYEALVEEEYENYSGMYDSKEDYEKENENYLTRTVLVEAVKAWIAEQTTFEK